MDPADAAELARRVRDAVVEEVPRRLWVAPVSVFLILAVVALAVALVLG